MQSRQGDKILSKTCLLNTGFYCSTRSPSQERKGGGGGGGTYNFSMSTLVPPLAETLQIQNSCTCCSGQDNEMCQAADTSFRGRWYQVLESVSVNTASGCKCVY